MGEVQLDITSYSVWFYLYRAIVVLDTQSNESVL